MENDQLEIISINCQSSGPVCDRDCMGCPLWALHEAEQLPKGKERQNKVRGFKDMFRPSLKSVLSGENNILDVSLVRSEAGHCRHVKSIPFFYKTLAEVQRVVQAAHDSEWAMSE